jgi:hypothetical protein
MVYVILVHIFLKLKKLRNNFEGIFMYNRMIISGFILLLFLFIDVNSLTLANASLEELTYESAVVIHGTVESVHCEWEDESGHTIRTIVRLQVEEYLKGSGASYIQVEQMGGQIGDIGDVIVGTPILNKGDEVILFLVNDQGVLKIHSIALGCYKVVQTSDGLSRAVNDLSATHLIDPDTDKVISRENSIFSYPINQFENQIRSIADQQ